ncbi:MAG: murein biosynthesis integral membrane protein MurJ [Firmicutes bacterium]|nr:murein biosynthesis integral membrane protein MurJ [Bacillota bacterium]
MSTGRRVAKAAGLMMVATVLSRILGYVRDVVIYTKFGQDSVTDAYNAAFSIPDFLYMLLVGGALSSAFIPVFSSYLATNQEEEGWRVASIVFNVVMLLMLIGIIIGLIFTPALMYLLVPHLPPAALTLSIYLTRIMFFQAFFMGLGGIAMGLLNAFNHFTAPALGGVFYNLVIIGVGLLLTPQLGIAAFSLGVVLGAVVNFALQLPPLLKLGLRYHFSFDLHHPGVQKMFILMIPVLIGLSVTQVNLFVNQNLASALPEGMISALRTAQRLMQLPIGIFAIAVAVAVFPTLTAQAARQEIAEFRRTFSLGVRTVIFVTFPAAVGLIVLRVPIVQLLFEQGNFDRWDTLATAEALLYYSLGIFAYSAIQVLNRVFYALQDTRTPVTVGVLTIVLNTVLSVILVRYMAHGGLALAYSIAGVFNMVLLLALLRPKIGHIGGRLMLLSFGQTLLASAAMAIFTLGTVQYVSNVVAFNPKINQLLIVSTGVTVGAVVFGVVALLLRMEEAEMVLNLVKGRFRRS